MPLPVFNLQRLRLAAGFALFVSLASSAAVFAQSVKDDETKDEEVVFDLAVFEVETRYDRGYLSTNTTSGTSLNTQIRDLPMGLEVINQEFIEDLQATDMKEALSYSPGVFMESFQNTSTANSSYSDRSVDVSPSTGISGSDFNDAVIIRGYSVPNQQRMGFRQGSIVPGYGIALGGISDSSNIERQEVVRGPQALLYGINVLSGIVNVIPKKPLGEFKTTLSLGVGSDNFFRGVLDTTGPLIKNKVNYRVVGSYMQEDDWIKFKSQERNYFAGQLEIFLTKKMKLFLEAQVADYQYNGIGPQFFTDTGLGDNGQMLNTYDEFYMFGRDWLSQTMTGSNGEYEVVEKEGFDYNYSDLGYDYNVTGPDTYRKREEYDLLAILNYSPIEGLDMEAGVYYTSVEDEEFNVRTGIFSDGTGLVQPRNYNYFSPNPEYDDDDPVGHGVGELFLVPDLHLDRLGEILEDTKYAYYWWYKRPTSAESLQFRYRIAYSMDTDWFNRIDGKHTFTGGFQYIEDQVSFVNANWNSLNEFYSINENNTEENNLAHDPFILRSSVFDYSPIRYDPDLGDLAIFGNLNPNGLGELPEKASVSRSGWIDTTLWYRGMYGIYHGRYFNERLTVIAGIRNDQYQVKEKERLRIMDPDRLSSEWQGGGNYIATPYFAGYGDKTYIYNDALPDALNEKVAADIELLRSTQPNGTVDYNFPDYQSYDTRTLGLSYRLTDAVSTYFLYSEGVFPNSGLRDGAYKAFEAERTSNNEIGFKFEFLDGKISGRVAYWEIERKNAVWRWGWAPAPYKWWGGPSADGYNNEDAASFSPRRVTQYLEDPTHPEAKDIRYGVRIDYIDEAWRQLGLGDQAPRIRKYYFLLSDYEEFGVDNIMGEGIRDPRLADSVSTYMMVNYHDMMAIDEEMGGMNPIKLAFDLASQNYLNLGDVPIMYYGHANVANVKAHSGSQYAGANVGYEEEGKGVDGSVIFSPIDNYQIIFGFSYQNREVTSFDLVAGNAVDEIGNVLEDSFTTEYDIWVFMLGPDNFEDPTDPSTLKSGAINGLDLSFVPSTHLSFWNKYRFDDGPLEDLEVGIGVNYYSSVSTSVSVGGEQLSLNPFPTPDIPERFVCDLYLGYRTRMFGLEWRFALNVYNLLDNTVSQAIKTYDGIEKEEHRRTRIYHDPRRFRLSATIYF